MRKSIIISIAAGGVLLIGAGLIFLIYQNNKKENSQNKNGTTSNSTPSSPSTGSSTARNSNRPSSSQAKRNLFRTRSTSSKGTQTNLSSQNSPNNNSNANNLSLLRPISRNEIREQFLNLFPAFASEFCDFSNGEYAQMLPSLLHLIVSSRTLIEDYVNQTSDTHFRSWPKILTNFLNTFLNWAQHEEAPSRDNLRVDIALLSIYTRFSRNLLRCNIYRRLPDWALQFMETKMRFSKLVDIFGFQVRNPQHNGYILRYNNNWLSAFNFRNIIQNGDHLSLNIGRGNSFTKIPKMLILSKTHDELTNPFDEIRISTKIFRLIAIIRPQDPERRYFYFPKDETYPLNENWFVFAGLRRLDIARGMIHSFFRLPAREPLYFVFEQ